MTKRTSTWTVLLAGFAIVVIGSAARFCVWSSVFVSGHVALLPSDSHYYIRFALRQLAHFPRFDTFDPYVNAPTGADIIWPPLHTLMVALAILLGGRATPEVGAAIVDPTLGTVELAILGIVAWRLYGSAAALLTLAFYAVLPAVVNYSLAGSCDHHVHEPFFIALVCLLLGRVLTDGSSSLAITAGLVIGSVRLFTPVAPMIVAIAAAACFGAVIVTKDADRLKALPRLILLIGGSAAAVLTPSVLLFGHVGSLGYESLSSFQPLFALSLFLAVGAVALWRAGDRRAAFVVLLAIFAAAPLVVEFVRAAGHMGRQDPLLAVAEESMPLTFAGALFGFGATILLVPVSVFGAVRMYRSGRIDALPALLAIGMLLPAALAQMRFTMLLSGPVIVFIAQALPEALAGLPMTGLIQGGLTLSACGLMWLNDTAPRGDLDSTTRTFKPTMEWMRRHLPPASVDGPMGDAKADYAIVANPFLGHQMMLWAEKPVVGTPFSQAPVHVAGNERVSQVFSGYNDFDVYTAMLATNGKYLLASAKMTPLGHPEIDEHSTYVGWLFQEAGLTHPTSGHFRLIYRSAEMSSMVRDASALELFEAVKGALLEGTTAPSATVTASLELIDNLGVHRDYVRSVTAAANGYWKIRVAYPTEDPDRPEVAPSPDGRSYAVKSESGTAHVAVSVDDIRLGKTVPVPPGS